MSTLNFSSEESLLANSLFNQLLPEFKDGVNSPFSELVDSVGKANISKLQNTEKSATRKRKTALPMFGNDEGLIRAEKRFAIPSPPFNKPSELSTATAPSKPLFLGLKTTDSYDDISSTTVYPGPGLQTPQSSSQISEKEIWKANLLQAMEKIRSSQTLSEKIPHPLTDNEIEEICEFIEQKKDDLTSLASKSSASLSLKAGPCQGFFTEGTNKVLEDLPTLPRPIECTSSGDIIVHFNKKSKKDKELGRGGFKKITSAVSVTTGQILASAVAKFSNDRKSFPKQPNKTKYRSIDKLGKETKALKSLGTIKGLTGKIPRLLSSSIYTKANPGSSAKKIRERMTFELCNLGSLDQTIKAGALTDSDKKTILKSLVSTVKVLHASGHIHCDIKPQNVLLHRKDSGQLKVILSDLEEVFDKDSEAMHTETYAPPEYFETDFEEFTKAYDMWSLGLTLFQVFDLGRRAHNITKLDEILTSVCAKSSPSLQPNWPIKPIGPRNSLNTPRSDEEKIIMRMLTAKPSARIQSNQC